MILSAAIKAARRSHAHTSCLQYNSKLGRSDSSCSSIVTELYCFLAKEWSDMLPFNDRVYTACHNIKRGILAEQIELDSIPGVCAPDGLCISNFGPVEGRLHDSTMLRESKLPPYLASHPMVQRLGMVIYGGPAYGVDELLCRPFHNAVERSSEKRFNEIMSKNRVSIK
ncbi:hypothetical protein PC118_g11857 [Phytophthora cactorum]|uniref:DDE Tnp4 domain-containing protein n=1 Tax=Phytophthora cactorum TaxID=29920 RepID=A0A8T1FNU8_9STRA|nr:hypothetical protein PC118_g11857 [Phytophthora cactorum]KAG3079671.1 hypothetical protein PC122_g12119 [Phytophthora cactorum]KAG3195934.1 hypothetical protein PC128_g8037 [Phytophthora cactorum]